MPSRDNQLVRVLLDDRDSQPRKSNNNEIVKVTVIKIKNRGPIELWAKACTEDSTPDLVRNVPNITNA